MRQIVAILGYMPGDRRYLLGGSHRKTHRFADTARRILIGAHLDTGVRHACCELCRREYKIRSLELASCNRSDCMERAAQVRGYPVRVVPIGRIS